MASITKVFNRLYSIFKKRNGEEVCPTSPPVIEPNPTSNQHIYVHLNKDKKTTPLFNLFNFSPTSEIPDIAIFKELYETLITEFTEETMPLFFIKRHIHNGEETITLYIIVKKEDTNNIINRLFLPFIYYILANCIIDIPHNKNVYLNITHPLNTSGLIGMHKDRSFATCLTYLQSPLTTELAFDEASIDLPWLTCSPLFRFDSSNKFYTLCFNDRYMRHTAPVFNEKDLTPSKTNKLEVGETIRETANKIRFVTKLDVDSDDSDEDSVRVDDEFDKPTYRKHVPIPKDRKVLMVFFEDTTYMHDEKLKSPSMEITITPEMLNSYKIKHGNKAIELSKNLMQIIKYKPSLEGIPFSGGNKYRKTLVKYKLYRPCRKTRKN